MENKAKGVKELFSEVIDAGLCAYCGACTGSCPYLVPYNGRIALLDNCTLAEGQCYQYCPRTYTDIDALSQQIFGAPYSEAAIGTTREVFTARSTDLRVKAKAQYGGTVSTLLSVAITEGLIDAAVMTKMSKEKIPGGFLARNNKEVLGGAGSSYIACPVLESYNRTPKDNGERLGVVGMPCQILALSKMKLKPPQNRVDIRNVQLVIGLFCTWALSAEGFRTFLSEKVDLQKVEKFDIPPPPTNRFDIYTGKGITSFPLEEIRKFTMPTCAYCLDMTAEFADISVGSAEGIEGWNTVIVRTDTGARLVEVARAKNILEIGALPSQNLAHLKEAALNKKKRALRQIVNKTGDKNNLLYLGLSPSLNKLLAQA
jgi:coenzyme F420 hydrogenase subunit beta